MKQTGWMKRLISLALLAAMVLSLMPVSALGAEDGRFGVIMIYNTSTDRTVKFRPQPGSTDYLASLSEYDVVKILGETTKNGVQWYRCFHWGTEKEGYVMAEFVQEMTDCELADWSYSTAATYNTSRRSSGAAGNQNYGAVYSAGSSSRAGYVRVTAASPVVYNENGTAKAADEYSGKIGQGDVVYYLKEAFDRGAASRALIYHSGSGLTGYLNSDSYVYAGQDDDQIGLGGSTVEGRAVGGLITTQGTGAYTSPGAVGIKTTGSDYYLTIPSGTRMVYFQEVKDYMGYNWALVRYQGRGLYIRSDAYSIVESYYTAAAAPTQAPASVPTAPSAAVNTPAPTVAVGSRMGYIVINNNTVNRVVNFRPKAGSSDYLAQLPEYRVVEILGDTTYNKTAWYQARPWGESTVGYLMASFVKEMNVGELAEWQVSRAATYRPGVSAPTAAPTLAPTGVITTIAPAATQVPSTAQVLGYIRTVADKVNLRQTPGGTVLNEYNQIPLGNVMAYYAIVQYDEYDWALVNYDGKTGYVRSDCYAKCDAAGNLLSAVTPVPSVVVTADGVYGQVTTDNVFFRKSMSTAGDFWARLPAGWMLEVLGSETKSGILWYKVKGGIPTNPGRTYTGYVHGNFFRLVETTVATPTPIPAATESNYGVVTLDAINLRQTPGGTPITALRVNAVVNILTKPAGNTANDWYYIETEGNYGYIPATALRVLLQSELSSYVLPAAPAAAPTAVPASSGTGYIKMVKTGVNIRKTPGGTVLTPKDQDRVPVNTVLAYSAGPVAADNYDWVLVTYQGVTGYVRSDCWRYCDASGNISTAPTAAPAVTPTPTPASGGQTALGYIKLIKGGVNVRTAPWKTSLGQLSKDTLLPYYGITYYNNTEAWYQVYAEQLHTYGYVLGSMAQVVGGSGAVTPTAAPDTTVTTGYIATTASSVWLRLQPKAGAETAGQVKNKGTVLPLVGTPVDNGIYTWYPVLTETGVRAYLRGDFVYQLADWQLAAYNSTGVLPTPTPGPATPRPGNSNFIMITTDKVWVRQQASTKAATLGQVNSGAVLPFSASQKVGRITWYKVTYNNKTAFIHGNYARVLTNAEYDSLKGTATPVPAATVPASTTVPDPANFSDVALTLIDKVIIRKTGSMQGRELTTVAKASTKLTYLGNYTAPTADNPYYWYNVRYGSVSGWMRGDLVKVLSQEEKKLYEQTGDPNAPREATYRTLSKNDTGEDVTALQLKLVEKGYLTADQVTGTYLTSTENAVIAFQRANSLTVDGIAGEKTQHALFGTVPVGYYDGSSVEAVLYPVEKIDWYTGGIQQIFSVGSVAVVTDVYTGISFKAQRLYGDNHADCEPQTTADTAAICQIFGVSNPQEISDRESELQSWRRRPLWVTIGGRTFAASMYGIPHNFKGDRIPDNNYNGQFCIHFVNSMTHGDSSNPAHVDTDAAYNGYFGHQSAIQYAYTHSISGTK